MCVCVYVRSSAVKYKIYNRNGYKYVNVLLMCNVINILKTKYLCRKLCVVDKKKITKIYSFKIFKLFAYSSLSLIFRIN